MYFCVYGDELVTSTTVFFFLYIQGCVQKFQGVDNEIYAYNNKHSLKSNTKGYVGKTH